jgi:hypothetical protein
VVIALDIDVRKVSGDVAEAGGAPYPWSSYFMKHAPKPSSECDA